jgi:hypothetical protein
MPIGLYSFADLIQFRNRSVVEFGLDTILATVQEEVRKHNERKELALGAFVAATISETQRQTGSGGSMVFRDSAEFSRDETQKSDRGETVGFPLKKKQLALGFTKYYFDMQSPQDVAERMQLVLKADINATYAEIGRALFGAANYTWFDKWDTQIDLNIKRLYNADGAPVPEGLGPTPIDGATHSHFFAKTALAVTDVRAAVDTVREHDDGATIQIEINNTNTAAVLALAGVTPAQAELLRYGADITVANVVQPANSNPSNRPVGVLDGSYLIHTKPYVPAGYMVIRVTNAGLQPLVRRRHRVDRYNGLHLEDTITTFPLLAQYMENFHGFGVWNRWSASVLQFNAAVNNTYQVPTFVG